MADPNASDNVQSQYWGGGKWDHGVDFNNEDEMGGRKKNGGGGNESEGERVVASGITLGG